MSFGWGPASEMNKTVQKLRRPKRETLKKIGDLITENDYQVTDKKATPEQLEEIRNRLRKDNLKAIVIKAIIFTILIGLFFYMIW